MKIIFKNWIGREKYDGKKKVCRRKIMIKNVKYGTFLKNETLEFFQFVIRTVNISSFVWFIKINQIFKIITIRKQK